MVNGKLRICVDYYNIRKRSFPDNFAFCILHFALKKPLPRNTGQRPTLLTTLITSVLSYAAPVTVGTGEAYCSSALCSGVMFDFCTSYRAYTVPDSLKIHKELLSPSMLFHTEDIIPLIYKYCKWFLKFKMQNTKFKISGRKAPIIYK